MESVYLLLGSNSGDREDYLTKALMLIDVISADVPVISSVYESEPWGFDSETWFLNLAVEIKSDLSPGILLERLQNIESGLGRIRDPLAKGYESRGIDIDIIFFGDRIIDSETLQIPHPKAHLRKFVLKPLCDLCPQFVHPRLGVTLENLLRECPDNSKVKLYI